MNTAISSADDQPVFRVLAANGLEPEAVARMARGQLTLKERMNIVPSSEDEGTREFRSELVPGLPSRANQFAACGSHNRAVADDCDTTGKQSCASFTWE